MNPQADTEEPVAVNDEKGAQQTAYSWATSLASTSALQKRVLSPPLYLPISPPRRSVMFESGANTIR